VLVPGHGAPSRNPSADPIKVRVTLNAEALDAGVAFTETAVYYTYNNSISIPPQTNNHVETQACDVPAGAKFWRVSTHAHKQAVRTEVKDGPVIAFASTDWERPGAATYMTPPFFAFATTRLTYQCTYNNPTNRTITSGESTTTDEMCAAVGYFFPATKPLICIDGFGPF
jgi:hypothetical protein